MARIKKGDTVVVIAGRTKVSGAQLSRCILLMM